MTQTRRAFLEKLDQLKPGLARAFEEAVADIRSEAQLRALEAAIARGDIEAALQTLRLGAEYFAPLDRAIREAYEGGAIWGLAQMPPKSLRHTGLASVRFQGRHPRAEAWVREAAGALIREISQDQSAMIREAILRGLEAGRGPRSLALDLVGRVDGNSRKGGLIGLTRKQAGWVQGARKQLEDLDRGYFSRTLRDRRFDRMIAKAIRDGQPLAKGDVDRIVGRYSDRMLKARGDTIARTETLRALNAGRYEGIQQMVESGKVPASAVSLTWEATPSGRTRDTHAAMHGQTIKLGGLFQSPSGALLAHPGDTDHGAGPDEVVNCRCHVRARVDWSALVR